MTYYKDGFIIFRSGKGYIIYNTLKSFKTGHTHLKSFKPCRDAITFVLLRKIPKKATHYYLTSLQRLSIDKTYIKQLENRKGR